jgi:hypothetical protein
VKFARRRPAEGSEAADDAPPPPTPPRGRPPVAFAGILDGRALWLAVGATPGSLALRDRDSGDVIAPPSEVAADQQPGYTSIRVDLAGLPGEGKATYDAVLAPTGGRAAQALWTGPLAGPDPAPADATTQYSLRRGDDGGLRVLRRPLAPAVLLREVAVTSDGIRLVLGDPASGQVVALIDESDQPLATYPLSDDPATAVITADGLPEGAGQLTRVVVGAPGAWLPVRRRANDLPDPGRAVPLPQLYDGDSEDPRLRLRWNPAGLLMARLLATGEHAS